PLGSYERDAILSVRPRASGDPGVTSASLSILGPRLRGDEGREFSQNRTPGYPAAGVKMVCGAAVLPCAIPVAVSAATPACQRHLARMRETQYSPLVPAHAGTQGPRNELLRLHSCEPAERDSLHRHDR